MVFTTRLSGGQRRPQRPRSRTAPPGRSRQKNGRPNHPQTQGKVERFQQTLKNWLAAQPAQPATLAQLQALLDTFTGLYNHQRPHRSLPHRATPATAYHGPAQSHPRRPLHRHPQPRPHRPHRHRRQVTLRHHGRLHHIGIGRTHARTPVLLLVQDLHIRVINAATGELLRELTLDPTRDYQPTGKPRGPKRRSP